MITTFFLNAFEQIINQYLNLDPDAMPKLGTLTGKVIAIEITTLDWKFYIIPAPDRLHLQDNFVGTADVCLTGSLVAFVKLATSENQQQLFASNQVVITGDTEVAQQLHGIFEKLDIDWEEQLSHYLGDVAAHWLCNRVHEARDLGKQTAAGLQQNLSEYLQEEARTLPPREEITDFYQHINTLRNDNERLTARIKRLEND